MPGRILTEENAARRLLGVGHMWRIPDGGTSLNAMKKPLRCLLFFHAWSLKTNDEGQQYKICDRCGAYRDFSPAAGAS